MYIYINILPTHHSECRVGVGHTAAPVGGESSLERWVPCRVRPESGMTNVAWTALGTLWCDPAMEGWGPCQNHIVLEEVEKGGGRIRKGRRKN